MRRAWLAVVALIVPLAGFECTVTVDHPDWTVGGTCNYSVDYNDAYCIDANTLMECRIDNQVYSVPCSSRCASGVGSCTTDIWGYGRCNCETPAWTPGATCNYWTDFPTNGFCADPTTLYMCETNNTVRAWDCSSECADGFCTYDPDLGYDWCMCPDWAWAPGYPCDYFNQYDEATCSGDTLTYCAETNVIGEISCQAQCEDWYGAGTTGTCGTQPDTGYNGCICDIPPACDHEPYCNDANWLVQCNADATADEWVDCNRWCIEDQGASKGVCEAGGCLCG